MEPFPVEYSSLSVTALLQFIRTAYGFGMNATITFLKRGFNDTYLVTNEHERYIFRIYKCGWRKIEDITCEMTLIRHLKENGISVSFPIEDKQSRLIQLFHAPEGPRYAVLFSYAEGEQVRKLSVERAFLLGKQSAGIHKLTENLILNSTPQDYDIIAQFEYSLRTLHPVLRQYPLQLDFLKRLQELFLNELNEAGKNELKYGICHGDLQAENFHINAKNEFTFFDFDFFGKGFLIYDIGVFMWYDHKNKPQEIMNAFLKGYEDVLTLSVTEKRLIPWMSTLRAVFQMTMYCRLSDGKQLPLWPPQQVAEFINKVEKWVNSTSRLRSNQ